MALFPVVMAEGSADSHIACDGTGLQSVQQTEWIECVHVLEW